MPHHRSLFTAYMLTLLLIGLGYMAMMPAFEGFDETAHLSSIRQIADTKTFPVYGKDMVDQETGPPAYHGPIPFSTGTPPFDTGRLIYPYFFHNPAMVKDYVTLYREPHVHPPFMEGTYPNWEAQHPPLYYALLAPLEKITDPLAFVTQFLLLRTASYLIALAGVVLAFFVAWKYRMPGAVAGFLLYPIVLPMFFPEYARLGGDCLCLFWVALIAWLLQLWMRDETNRKLALSIGVVFGLGMVTKAFFLPIAAAFFTFLLLRIWKEKTLRNWPALVWMALPALLGACWYVYQLHVGGSGAAGHEAVDLGHKGGLVASLRAHFPLFTIVRGIVATFTTWVWTGTWSVVHLPLIFFVPLLALIGWIIAAYLWQLRRYPVSDPVWLTFWCAFFFGGGFLYHILVSSVLLGDGTTGGWYFHIVMPWVAPALGMGALAIWRQGKARFALIALLAYAAAFQIVTLWCQFTLYTGCSTKSDTKVYAFSDHSFCLAQTPGMIERLGVLAWPALTAVCFAGGVLCALWVITIAKRSCPEPVADEQLPG